MVADRVAVSTRSHLPEEQGWRWTSEGAGGYEMEPVNDLPRGTTSRPQSQGGCAKVSQDYELERIIKHYSNFVQFPIDLNGKALNTVQAIWSRSKKEIKEEEYDQFYQYISHDTEKPLCKLHFTADAPLSIQALLFIPRAQSGKRGGITDQSGSGSVLPEDSDSA